MTLDSNRKPRIYVSSRSFGKLSQEPVNMVRKVADLDVSSTGKLLKENELEKLLPNYDGIIVGADEMTRKAILSSERLKFIAKHGAGVDNIDLKAATEKGVIVTYVPSVNAESVADFTFGLMLAIARKIVDAHVSTQSGKWESGKFVGTELHNKTLGIIGMGKIGVGVARRAKGFDMKILCYTAHPEKHAEETKKYGIEYVALKELLKESDFVTIHAALTAETAGLIDENRLALMKRTAFLINTARGSIIDESALYKALKNKWIAGVTLDVYNKEPPEPECPLFKLDNVVVTPHIASYTVEAINNVDFVQAKDILKVLNGEKPEFVANPEVFNK